jgi:uncharacterized protein YcbX
MSTQTEVRCGTITALRRYPVKSMAGEELQAAEFGPRGMVGDRAYAIVDPETGKVASAKNPKKWPNLFDCAAGYLEAPDPGRIPAVRMTLPDGSVVNSDADDLDGILAALLGRPGVLQQAVPEQPVLEEYVPDMEEYEHRDEVIDGPMLAGTFFDAAPVHVLTTGTIESLLAVYPDGMFDIRRFRPNILIETPAEAGPFPESEWIGRTLTIGDVELRITGHCGRCVMTTLPQPGIARDPLILRTAAQHNAAHVGIYAEVSRAGSVRLGDVATLS